MSSSSLNGSLFSLFMEEQPAKFNRAMLNLTESDKEIVWLIIAKTPSEEIEDRLIAQRAARENRRPLEHEYAWAERELAKKIAVLAKYFSAFV
jgi:hypothetical protein